MNIRTDLAIERLELAEASLPDGAKRTEEMLRGVKVTTVHIGDSEAAQALGKPEGRYLTVDCAPFRGAPAHFEEEVMAVAEAISRLLPEGKGAVLVTGLGNSSITPDALGPEVVNLMLATRHIAPEMAKAVGLEGLRAVSVIAPGVLGQTGIETCEILEAIVRQTKPEAVVVVDALAAGDIARLGTTVQICDSGISPGSGVANRRRELSPQTLGVPVVAVGVPTVVDYPTDGTQTMMVTPREVDTIIENAAKTVAFAINKALQPQLELDDILALVN